MAKEKYVPKHAAEPEKKKSKPKTEQKPKPKKEELAEREVTPKKNKRAKALKTVIPIIAVLLIMVIVFAVSAKNLKKQATSMKADIRKSAECVMAGDIDGAEKAWNSAEKTEKAVHKKLSNLAWKFAGTMPIVGGDIKSARTLLEVFDDASNAVVKPGFELIKEYPLSKLKLEEGYNAELLVKYLDFASDNTKNLEGYATTIQGLKFRFIKFGNSEATEKITKYAALFKESEPIIKLFKNILGNGEDRFYIIPAQNMSEIRASGGFPGSIGSMQIKDGILTIGDFRPINDVIYYANMPGFQPTKEEYKIFSGNIQYARDMCYIPDFERVGASWAASYEYKTNTPQVDGVIALTPTVVQEILRITDQKVTLSDGTEIDGKNATKTIEHDIYFKYFKKGAMGTQTANDLTDELFAETAEKAIEIATGNFRFSHAVEYIELLQNSFKERTIVMWFDDEATQQLCRDAGCAGTLDCGAFFSCCVPSKLGWFFDMSADVKDNGDNTYDITLTLKNILDNDEAKQVSTYVTGYTYGDIIGYLHLVAPMGGEISDIKASDGTNFTAATYHGFDLYYSLGVKINKGETITISYTVTSEDPINFVTTPTFTNHR